MTALLLLDDDGGGDLSFDRHLANNPRSWADGPDNLQLGSGAASAHHSSTISSTSQKEQERTVQFFSPLGSFNKQLPERDLVDE